MYTVPIKKHTSRDVSYLFYRRIRDNLADHEVQTHVKQVDAFSFTLGVVLTLYVEYVVLAHPEYYPTFFYAILCFLMTHRFYAYGAIKEHFFMLDFCYFVQLSTHLQTITCSNIGMNH